MRIAKVGISVLLIIGGSGLCVGQAGGQAAAEIFPMRKGTRWIYRGDVAWQAIGGGTKVERSRLDWTMEVVDDMRGGRYKAALIRGHPQDLRWYEVGRERGCDILIGVDDKEFHLIGCAPSASRQKLSLTEDDLRAMINEENLIFRLPIRQGDSFGGDPERRVNDGMYEWYVQAVRRATLGDIRGISIARSWTEYVLAYRTNPDHEVGTYVPGIGLTAYVYSHHGTVSDVNLKLIEFQPPSPR